MLCLLGQVRTHRKGVLSVLAMRGVGARKDVNTQERCVVLAGYAQIWCQSQKNFVDVLIGIKGTDASRRFPECASCECVLSLWCGNTN